ncbi:MAG TPA: hypothetical protein VFE53_16610 [Mucilaginibacter sp.]|nr:hypothetical protein [Mucilaginibacter sp.]
MKRLHICGGILKAEGILLLGVAAVHMAVIPLLKSTFAAHITPADFRTIWSPFLLGFSVMGLLLIPLGLTTWLAGQGVIRRERWAFRIGLINAVTVLCLPVTLVLVMERRYFDAVPFVIGSILVTIVGLSMLWPLLWVRNDFTDARSSLAS